MAERSEEKRIFRRYKRFAEFFLKIDAERYKCQTVDYSADGICLYFLDRSPSISAGKIVQIDIEEFEIDLLGEVMWKKDLERGAIVGFRRVGAIKGSCQEFRLPDILIGLQRSMKTGVLKITSGAKVTKIFINNGDMVFAQSNSEDDRFGEVLLKEGKITLEQYFEASEILQKTGRRLGSILIDLGHLDPSELTRAVRHQVMEIVVHILVSECGYFEFEEGPLPSSETIKLNFSAATLIYNSIKRINNFQYILQDFPPLDTVLTLSQDPMDLFQDLSLDEQGKEILSYITGETTIRDVLTPELLNDFDTIKTIYALISARVIVEKIQDEPAPSVTPEEIISEPMAKIDAEFIKMIHDVYESCTSSNFYEILCLKEDASEEEIKKAYFRMAKEFHPDRHFSIPLEETKNKLKVIVDSVTDAYNVLSDPQKRAEYDRSRAGTNNISSRYQYGTEKEMARAKFNEGRSKMLLGFYDQAQQLFSEAIRYENSEPTYYYYQGLALSRLGFYKESAASLKHAITIDPGETNYHIALGFTFMKLGFKERAKSSFRKALDLSPLNEKAIEGLRSIEE